MVVKGIQSSTAHNTRIRSACSWISEAVTIAYEFHDESRSKQGGLFQPPKSSHNLQSIWSRIEKWQCITPARLTPAFHHGTSRMKTGGTMLRHLFFQPNHIWHCFVFVPRTRVRLGGSQFCGRHPSRLDYIVDYFLRLSSRGRRCLCNGRTWKVLKEM